MDPQVSGSRHRLAGALDQYPPLREPGIPSRILVTGGAGFIASHLVDRLLSLGHHVTVYDNFSTGQMAFLHNAVTQDRFKLVRADLLDTNALDEVVPGHDVVFHLAANADVRFGVEHPDRDLKQNILATHNLLEAMRRGQVHRIVFSSTGSIYGEPTVFPTPEDCPLPIQTSLYGASKLAAEGLITAYCEGFGFRAQIFRFVSILGERYSHGHIFDFFRKLEVDPIRIEVLGNGRQRKSYLYVQDCIDAILLAVDSDPGPVGIFNLGTNEYCAVDESLGWICDELGLRPERVYAGGNRGWVGDSPFIYLDCSRIRALGWRPTLSIEAGVRRTLAYLRESRWLLEARA
ncbi:MAG TPA: NAD-dependent epimerase/dehydratase family protein [Chloroflexota bacterium]|nr:NAD-dependent epimerase/dehydratase family protein [Chloroflexota bacterium]